jgi:hypothetical protein
MNSATISADIISYTSLSDADKKRIIKEISDLIQLLSKKYKDESFYGRITQGDYIECALISPKYILRIALILKTYIKSLNQKDSDINYKRLKYFKEYAIRLAIAVAPLTTLDNKKGIIDGEAIYMSGRALKGYSSTSNKKRIIIKNTLNYYSSNEKDQEKYNAILSLLDTIIARCSSRQCEIVYYKLLGLSEKDISNKLGKSQSTISQHSTSAGWQSISKAVKYFENSIS